MPAGSAAVNEAGYTLAEMLAALFIIGLSLGGLTSAVGVLGRMQAQAARADQAADSQGRISGRLRALLTQAGPFFADGDGDFTGDAAGFSFPCNPAAAGRCGARLESGDTGPVIAFDTPSGAARTRSAQAVSGRFTYYVGATAYDHWPAGRDPDARLSAVTLWLQDQAGARRPSSAALVPTLRPDCRYDPISQRCRRREGR